MKEANVYTKGASEVILSLCTCYITSNGEVKPITSQLRLELETTISKMAKESLRTIAIAYKTIVKPTLQEDVNDCESNLILQGIVGIKDPLRPDVIAAVQACHAAGIFVRMVTGDNIETAKAIAKECGILTNDGLALEGPNFRKLKPNELDVILPKLQVLARSSPEDKHILVTRLNGIALPCTKEEWELQHPNHNYESERDVLLPGYKEEWLRSRSNGIGEVVGVTGDGTNDAPALKAADVGLSMGLSGTDGKLDELDFTMTFSLVV